MEKLSHAMAGVGPRDCQSMFLHVFPDYIPDFPVHDPRLANPDGQFESSVRFLDQEFGALRNFAHREGLVQIRMEPVFESADI